MVLKFYSFLSFSSFMAKFYRRRYTSRSRRRTYGRRVRYSRFSSKKSAFTNGRSARQMTQNSLFQIAYTTQFDYTIAVNSTFKSTLINVGLILKEAVMHKTMSDCFDQCRIERVVMKISPVATNMAAGGNYYSVFTALDRNGFAAPDTLTQNNYRSYSSYKETSYSSAASNKAPVHTVSFNNNTLFEKSAYYNTKKVIPTPFVALGVVLSGAVTGAAINYGLRVEFSFDVRYRGVRHDASAIANEVSAVE